MKISLINESNYEVVNSSGKAMVTKVPLPIVLSISIAPPHEVMTAFAIERPKPDPRVLSVFDPR